MKTKEEHNSFKEIGFIRFWLISLMFWATFPFSIGACYLAMGPDKTKQFFKALVYDFLQTLLAILVVLCIFFYVIYHFVSTCF
tara:strand:+ start:279 stop:527 length:249 start_codon:yes stop_codon:yes gene_type:complete